MATATTQRASCWSITINNPTDEDIHPALPPGWKLEGQIEQGQEGTTHFQGMVRTTQVRFSAVKAVFPRAHIESARNVRALANYVHKEETRIAEVPTQGGHMNVYGYISEIAKDMDITEVCDYLQTCRDAEEQLGITGKGVASEGDLVLDYVDGLIREKIESGVQGVEFLAVNPIWRSVWKRFWRSILIRAVRSRQTDRQTDDTKEDPPADKISMAE